MENETDSFYCFCLSQHLSPIKQARLCCAHHHQPLYQRPSPAAQLIMNFHPSSIASFVQSVQFHIVLSRFFKDTDPLLHQAAVRSFAALSPLHFSYPPHLRLIPIPTQYIVPRVLTVINRNQTKVKPHHLLVLL